MRVGASSVPVIRVDRDSCPLAGRVAAPEVYFCAHDQHLMPNAEVVLFLDGGSWLSGSESDDCPWRPSVEKRAKARFIDKLGQLGEHPSMLICEATGRPRENYGW